jgi:hypothetical protein
VATDEAVEPVDPDEAKSIAALAAQMLVNLRKDLDNHLDRIDNYIQGEHDDPYMPPQADDEYRLLAKRAVSNWCPLIISTPAQALYVDSFRRGNSSTKTTDAASSNKVEPEWDHWQQSRLDSRQSAIYRAAIGYGHSFTVTEKDDQDRVRTKGLSPLKTTALFEDPANDITPITALHVVRWGSGEKPGLAYYWDEEDKFTITFLGDTSFDPDQIKIVDQEEHGASECPVTRFHAYVDLQGRTTGVIEPVIPLQNRINQTVFDLLVAQTYSSFKVRWVSGMVPPIETEPIYEVDGDDTTPVVGAQPVLDESTGQPKPRNIDVNARRFLFAEDHEARFGTLDESPLQGFIDSLDMSIRHLSALRQIPPHHLLGQIANLSAEALQAAEISLQRMVQEFQMAFGESWERVFRLAAELAGDTALANDFSSEVIWRDLEQRAISQAADGLGKLADQLGIPKRGLWRRVPNVTANELSEWEELRADEDSQLQLADALNRATHLPEEPLNDDSIGRDSGGQPGLSSSTG